MIELQKRRRLQRSPTGLVRVAECCHSQGGALEKGPYGYGLSCWGISMRKRVGNPILGLQEESELVGKVGDHLCSREGCNVQVAQGEHTEQLEERNRGALVSGLCAGGAPGKGRWENQELLRSGDWESFSEGGGLQRPELPRGIPKALYSGFHHAEVAVGQQESRFGEGGGQET